MEINTSQFTILDSIALNVIVVDKLIKLSDSALTDLQNQLGKLPDTPSGTLTVKNLTITNNLELSNESIEYLKTKLGENQIFNIDVTNLIIKVLDFYTNYSFEFNNKKVIINTTEQLDINTDVEIKSNKLLKLNDTAILELRNKFNIPETIFNIGNTDISISQKYNDHNFILNSNGLVFNNQNITFGSGSKQAFKTGLDIKDCKLIINNENRYIIAENNIGLTVFDLKISDGDLILNQNALSKLKNDLNIKDFYFVYDKTLDTINLQNEYSYSIFDLSNVSTVKLTKFLEFSGTTSEVKFKNIMSCYFDDTSKNAFKKSLEIPEPSTCILILNAEKNSYIISDSKALTIETLYINQNLNFKNDQSKTDFKKSLGITEIFTIKNSPNYGNYIGLADTNTKNAFLVELEGKPIKFSCGIDWTSGSSKVVYVEIDFLKVVNNLKIGSLDFIPFVIEDNEINSENKKIKISPSIVYNPIVGSETPTKKDRTFLIDSMYTKFESEVSFSDKLHFESTQIDFNDVSKSAFKNALGVTAFVIDKYIPDGQTIGIDTILFEVEKRNFPLCIQNREIRLFSDYVFEIKTGSVSPACIKLDSPTIEFNGSIQLSNQAVTSLKEQLGETKTNFEDITLTKKITFDCDEFIIKANGSEEFYNRQDKFRTALGIINNEQYFGKETNTQTGETNIYLQFPNYCLRSNKTKLTEKLEFSNLNELTFDYNSKEKFKEAFGLNNFFEDRGPDAAWDGEIPVNESLILADKYVPGAETTTAVLLNPTRLSLDTEVYFKNTIKLNDSSRKSFKDALNIEVFLEQWRSLKSPDDKYTLKSIEFKQNYTDPTIFENAYIFMNEIAYNILYGNVYFNKSHGELNPAPGNEYTTNVFFNKSVRFNENIYFEHTVLEDLKIQLGLNPPPNNSDFGSVNYLEDPSLKITNSIDFSNSVYYKNIYNKTTNQNQGYSSENIKETISKLYKENFNVCNSFEDSDKNDNNFLDGESFFYIKECRRNPISYLNNPQTDVDVKINELVEKVNQLYNLNFSEQLLFMYKLIDTTMFNGKLQSIIKKILAENPDITQKSPMFETNLSNEFKKEI